MCLGRPGRLHAYKENSGGNCLLLCHFILEASATALVSLFTQYMRCVVLIQKQGMEQHPHLLQYLNQQRTVLLSEGTLLVFGVHWLLFIYPAHLCDAALHIGPYSWMPLP